MAIERERQFTADVCLKNTISPSIDPSRIPRLRNLLKIKRINKTPSRQRA